MQTTLENEHLQITLKKEGAELTRMYSKEHKIDYLWNGNPDFWKRHAPILFPIVGKLKDNKYRIENTTYNLPQHGFARDAVFEIINSETDTITFELRASEDSLQKYPYGFELQITYTLKANKLQINYKVINTDNKTIYFSIGAHPAFNCPLIKGTTFNDYYIEFEHNEAINQLHLDTNTGLISPNKTEKKVPKKLPLSYDVFKNDAVIFEGLQSESVSLKSTKHQHGITMKVKNWDYFAFWTKKDTPFICFEPWMGIADFTNTNQNFKEKIGIKKLPTNEEFEVNYTISFF